MIRRNLREVEPQYLLCLTLIALSLTTLLNACRPAPVTETNPTSEVPTVNPLMQLDTPVPVVEETTGIAVSRTDSRI